MRMRVMASVVSLAVVLGGCGDTAPSAETATQSPAAGQASSRAARIWAEADVRRLARLRRNREDLTYRLAAHPECVATSLLRSRAEVRSYEASGDVVVTNPDGSAGVKVSGQSASCQRLFAQALANVR